MMGNPNFIALALLWCWPAIAAALFSSMPPRRALAAGFVFGWLFLPMMAVPFPLVKFDKHTATSLGALLGVLIFDTKRLSNFKLSLIDLPMAVWCVMPIPAALSNSAAGLGAYDGIAAAATEIVKWWIPYVLGRMYFGDAIGLRGLAVWTFIGGVAYIPFCMIEVAISPQLHFMVYGFYQHDFSQVFRMGGYRPMVFMQHGIAVGNQMAASFLAGFWLWWSGSLKTLFKMPVWVSVMGVLGTTIAVKSTGALLLAMIGLGALFALRMTKNQFALLIVCLAPFGYMTARTVGGWTGENLVKMIAENLGEDRSLSMQCRFENENLLIDKAMQKSMFGWGPNGRYLVLADDGETIVSIPDGMWVIALGSTGIVGLTALFVALNLPTLAMIRRIKGSRWSEPLMSGAVVFAVLLPIHTVDNLMNTMLNPLFMLGLGGLAGFLSSPNAVAASPGRQQQPGFPVLMGQRGMA